VQAEIMMLDSTGFQLKAFSSFQFTYVQVKTGKPVLHPEYFLSIYNKILYKTEDKMPQYNDRLKSLKLHISVPRK
jgi:ribosome biogenesis SPOUT family RNA methylase Rps3